SGNHAEVFVARNRTHMSLNQKIGAPGDGPTTAILKFLKKQLK
ncbi:MAG TPA: alpha/beta hydrolase, partial [Verrucomicrobiales bacterium]|nr:alpha/beta hydrolase [Verrucomicrobiales bacterium]